MSNPCLLDENGNVMNPKIPRYEIKGKILWENKNIGKLTSGTKINLESDNYDIIFWVFALSVTSIDSQAISACLKGKNCILDTRTSSSNIYVYRLLTCLDDTTYQVGNGFQNAGTNDENAIPLMAIGFTLS